MGLPGEELRADSSIWVAASNGHFITIEPLTTIENRGRLVLRAPPLSCLDLGCQRWRFPVAKNKPSRKGECVYCGEIKQLSDDHIPPKNLFAKPRPNNLIAVPSCISCNGDASDDDEYFRLILTLREDTFPHPDVQQILPIVFRSLTKPNKKGFSKSLFQSIKVLNLMTSSGLFIGRHPTYGVDLDRLDRVVQRIVKGLFYHEQKSRLPDHYDAFACSASGLSNLARDLKAHIVASIVDPILVQTPKTIGNNVFTYRFIFAPEDPNVSAWHLIFYEKVVFLCFTAPRPVNITT
jgi:hypothetical protein